MDGRPWFIASFALSFVVQVKPQITFLPPEYVLSGGNVTFVQNGYNNLYGNNVTYRSTDLKSSSQKCWVDYETPLPAGVLVKFYFYVHKLSSTIDSQSLRLRLQIWREKDHNIPSFLLVWQQRVEINYTATGALYSFKMNTTVLIAAGDKIGFTNEGDYGPISFTYVERHRTYFAKVNWSNTTSTPVYPLKGDVVKFDYTYLPSIFSIAVEVEPIAESCFEISVEPLFGPIAGGTNLRIIVGSETIECLLKYAGSAITGVRAVFIGEKLSSTYVSLLPSNSSAFEILAVTPSTTEASIGQHLSIAIEFLPTPFNMTFNRSFTYLPNPEIESIYPNSFIATGGILLDVTGRNLSSVAKPYIKLTVIITRAGENGSTSSTETRVCTVPPGNNTYMECPMPPLHLTDDFLDVLNLLYSNNTSLRRDTNGLPVLTVYGRNGSDRADIYLGFILDGYRKYEQITDALPNTRLIFFSAPEINSSNQLLEFDPSRDELIYIKGRYMMRGCRIKDYIVHIGNQICTNVALQDNQLSCLPPKEEPRSTANDINYCDQYLSVTVTLGYKEYQYTCLKYTDQALGHAETTKPALIVGLTVGLAGFALFSRMW